jgi:hypothetical protein
MTAAAPGFRAVDALTGQLAARPSKFFAALTEADTFCGERDLNKLAFAAAVGEYSCLCGSAFEFDVDSTLEEYAALNRWLGLHCSDDHNAAIADDQIAELAAAKESIRRLDRDNSKLREQAAALVSISEENARLKAERSELYRQLEQTLELHTRVDELTAEDDAKAELIGQLTAEKAVLQAQFDEAIGQRNEALDRLKALMAQRDWEQTP